MEGLTSIPALAGVGSTVASLLGSSGIDTSLGTRAPRQNITTGAVSGSIGNNLATSDDYMWDLYAGTNATPISTATKAATTSPAAITGGGGGGGSNLSNMLKSISQLKSLIGSFDSNNGQSNPAAFSSLNQALLQPIKSSLLGELTKDDTQNNFEVRPTNYSRTYSRGGPSNISLSGGGK